jgi:V/A-type H+-transporting ATPase subunit D
LQAAVRSAAASEALRRIDAEVAVTRRRLRALDKAWLPALQHAMATLELVLEQAEQDDGTRLRRGLSPKEKTLT